MAQQEGKIGPPYSWQPADNTPPNLERCEAYEPNADRDYTKYMAAANAHPITSFLASLLPSRDASEKRLQAHLEQTEEGANKLKLYWMQPVQNAAYWASPSRNLAHGALKEHLKEKPRIGSLEHALHEYSK